LGSRPEPSLRACRSFSPVVAMVSFVYSLVLFAFQAVLGTSTSVVRKELATSGSAEADAKYLHQTTEQERTTYLKSHANTVAVIPGAISKKDASKLHEAIDRRWRHVKMAHVRHLAAQGGDGDDLVDAVDLKPSYAADIISDGSCTAGDTHDQEFMLQKDCDLAKRLLQKHVTPLVEQKVKEWMAQTGTEVPETLYACDSFVKRYMPGERHGLHAHRDMTSLWTANVLLSDPDKFQGGLAMYPEADELTAEDLDEQGGYLDEHDMGRGVFLEHGQDVAIGELVLHRGSVWHGVEMGQPDKSERYSWITWYSPVKEDCSEYQWRDKQSDA